MSEVFEVYLITSNNSTEGVDEPFGDQVNKIISHKMPSSAWRRLTKVFTPYFIQFSPSWIQEAASNGVDLIEQHGIDIVITLSMTLSNAEVGYRIKKRQPHVNLVSFFSDPITISPYFARNQFERWAYGFMERRFFAASSKIVTPSVLMAEAYSKKYPEYGSERFVTITHSHADFLLPPNPKKQHDSEALKVIRYIGGMNTIRSPLRLVDYVEANAEWFIERNIKFEFYGRLSKRLKFQISSRSFDERVVEFCGKVPYTDVPELIVNSVALLTIDANFDSKLSYGCSKAIEMLPYRIPIIALTPKGSETDRVMQEVGYRSFGYDEMSEIKVILDEIDSIKPEGSRIEFFSITSVKNAWKQLLAKLT
jgi:hypothetical protein